MSKKNTLPEVDTNKVMKTAEGTMGKIKFEICSVWGQVYILPYIKVTHNRKLNGDLELIIGWLNKELVIGI
jgi:hypothetical protein